MKRGLIFSVDAIFAVIVALSLIVALVSVQQSEKGKEKAFEAVAQSARDKAIVGFYSHSIASDNPAALPLSGNKAVYCSSFFSYNPAAGTTQEQQQQTKKCAGLG